MANKLEDLTITKVAFVPEGDNKKANVLLFKRKGGASGDDAAPEEAEPKIDHEDKALKKFLIAFGKAFGFGNDEQTNNKPTEIMKGAIDVKFDKSKLSPEELATLEALEKKAGVTEEPTPDTGNTPTQSATAGASTTPVAPAAPATPAAPAAAAAPATSAASAAPATVDQSTYNDDDIYKGLHPAVKAELERLRKSADAVEERELTEIAKKYQLIGKKPEELVPTLKALKAAGGDAYNQMIAVLDASLAAVEKSGIFSEVGKRGTGETNAWAAIEKHAETIQKAAPTLTWSQAIDKACEQHPELVHEYENNR